MKSSIRRRRKGAFVLTMLVFSVALGLLAIRHTASDRITFWVGSGLFLLFALLGVST